VPTIVGGQMASNQPAAVGQTHMQTLRVASIGPLDPDKQQNHPTNPPEASVSCHRIPALEVRLQTDFAAAVVLRLHHHHIASNLSWPASEANLFTELVYLAH